MYILQQGTEILEQTKTPIVYIDGVWQGGSSNYSDPEQLFTLTVTPDVPQSITKVQAMEAMMQTDIDTVHGTSMWTAFKVLIVQNEQANDRWILAQVLERKDPFVAMLAPALGKTDAQIDELFILAGSL